MRYEITISSEAEKPLIKLKKKIETDKLFYDAPCGMYISLIKEVVE